MPLLKTLVATGIHAGLVRLVHVVTTMVALVGPVILKENCPPAVDANASVIGFGSVIIIISPLVELPGLDTPETSVTIAIADESMKEPAPPPPFPAPAAPPPPL